MTEVILIYLKNISYRLENPLMKTHIDQKRFQIAL
jgi:hypothetical protein